MIDTQVRVCLRVGERGVEVVTPGRDSDGSGVVRPLGLRALEKLLGEDLRDLVVGCVYAVLAERVGGFDGGDEGGVVCEEDGEVGGGVVVADGEDTMSQILALCSLSTR